MGIGSSYGGLNKFKPKGYKKIVVREWLQTQDAYTLHKPTRRSFHRRQVVVYGIDDQWQADLVDLGKLASYNKGFKYLLTCIDVLSRYAHFFTTYNDETKASIVERFNRTLKIYWR